MKNFFFLALCALFATIGISETRTLTDSVLSRSGGSVNFPGGLSVPSTGQLKIDDKPVRSGTAALTLAAGTNVAAVVTPVTLKYTQTEDHVCLFGQVSIDPTSDATASTFTLTLPVSRANFSGTGAATGFAGILGATVGACLSTDSAQTITCNYVSGGTAVELVPVSACYNLDPDNDAQPS